MPKAKSKEAELAAVQDETTSMQIEIWDIEKVRPTLTEYNPRLISDRALDDLKNGIKKFGCILPVVINQRTQNMVGGHQRFRASEALGLSEIPVTLVDLDVAAEKSLNLALNKIEGKWDYALLEDALTQVSEADLLIFSGFSESDLIEILSGSEEEYTQTFQQFATRMSQQRSQNFVAFRSPQVTFQCSRSAYDAFLHLLQSKVGVDDKAVSDEFFRMIGLE
jgi:ParB-like nuclease domain